MDEKLEIVVFYVGLGDCIHITLPNDKQILIDTGVKQHFNRIRKKLNAMGKTIDYLILTHSHVDHVNGALNFIEEFAISNVVWWISEGGQPSQTNISLKNAVIRKIRESMQLQNNENYFKVYSIFQTPPEWSTDVAPYLIRLHPIMENQNFDSNPNKNSIVLAFKFHEDKFHEEIILLMADATKNEEEKLLAALNPNNHNLRNPLAIKIGHHGSNTSTSQNFQNSFQRNSDRYLICSNKARWKKSPPSEEKLTELYNNRDFGSLSLTGMPEEDVRYDIHLVFTYNGAEVSSRYERARI